MRLAKMKTNIKQVENWWTYDETCDKCGVLICGHERYHTAKPDIKEADFCIGCLKYLRENHIPYETAK